ncbi:MAG TPA: LPS assembly protein LptD [Candidatus Polarisedimenticolia bacterium]|nr:LPS assembly protein LptD [Candidatus Polarisedimenticolia bacterium]
MNRRRPAAALLACALLCPSPASAREDPLRPPASEQPVVSAGSIEQIAEGEMVMRGDVDLRYGELRLLADTIHFNDATRIARAEGNVVMMFGKSQISGDRLEVNVETRLATIWNAHGYVDPDIIFQAEKLERIADDKVVITDGTVTTCTQPTPYWSFHVGRAVLHLDHYAHMRNVAFDVGKVPVIYLPYMVWPMKQDRASGLLLPNLGYSRRRGSFIGNALYLVLGRSQDATLYYDRYGRSGTGLGFEYRFVPSSHGEGMLTGYYVNDTVEDPLAPGEAQERTRYRFKLLQNQQFRSGYRLLADLNSVSDLDYFLDFERDIRQTTSPIISSRIDLVRNFGNYAFNVRADRQDQFLTADTDLTLQRLPELELRGRGIRFGRSPFYLSFETSAGVFSKEQEFLDSGLGFVRRETTYQRYDLFPTISASFTPTPWLDISPSISARETIYTRSVLDPDDPLSVSGQDDVSREFVAFNLGLVGPRFYRLYGAGKGERGAVYKHTFEPRISYAYIPEVRGGERIIRFDEVDTLAGDVHRVAYSLTSRLFAKRPDRSPADAAVDPDEAYASDITGPTQIQAPVTDVKDLPDEMKEALRDDVRAPSVGAVEVATFDLSQEYSLDRERPRSVSTVFGLDGVSETRSAQAGPVVATIRYNPAASASLDVRTEYDILHDDVRNVSLSANLRSLRHGYMRLSWFLGRDFEGRFLDEAGRQLQPGCAADPNVFCERAFVDANQIRLIGGTAFLNRKITLDLEGSYDLEGGDLQDQRYRLGYNTQCCGMLLELARRDFETIDEIQYRFILNLRGVGTFLDLQGRPR